MDGVSEDSVGMRESDPRQSRGLRFICRDIDNLAGNEAVDDFDLGSQDVLFGNPKIAYAPDTTHLFVELTAQSSTPA